jgi:uncharacterized protein YkwD
MFQICNKAGDSMRNKLTVLILTIAILFTFSAQAACNTGNNVELSVPTGYRGVDCTYTVYVNGTQVCTGTTDGACTITIPDYGDCSYKVVYGEVAAASKATAAPTQTSNCAAAAAKASVCPTSTPDYTGTKVSRKAKKYYSSKATATPAATAAPTVATTAAPTAAPTAKPTAVATAKPTAVATAKPTATPTKAATGSTSSSLASQVVALVNEYRAEYGLSPLTVDSDLSAAACVRAKECAVSFSHTRPDGSSWSTVSSKARGENIAMGYNTAEKVMAAWMTSEGHRANIFRESFTTIGVCAYEQNGVIDWAQEFGTN